MRDGIVIRSPVATYPPHFLFLLESSVLSPHNRAKVCLRTIFCLEPLSSTSTSHIMKLTTKVKAMASAQATMSATTVPQPRYPLRIKAPPVFRVMDLPIETRIKIWKYVVLFDKPIDVEHHHRKQVFPPSHLRSGKQVKLRVQVQEQREVSSQFALASTCRQVYLEVAPIYYGMNTFSIESKALKRFLDAIGPENTKAITSLVWERKLYGFYAVAPQLEGLKRLELVGDCLTTLFDEPYSKEGIQKLQRLKPSLEVILPEFDQISCRSCLEYMDEDPSIRTQFTKYVFALFQACNT